nr:hypothetical protein [Grifola frondosa]
MGNNGWLAGFIEADGGFQVSIRLNKEGKLHKLDTDMTLNIRQDYPKHSDFCSSYLPIMEKIANFLNVKVRPYTRERKIRGNEKGYRVRATSLLQRNILIDYFTKFPLLSSKRLDYLDWVKAHNIRVNREYTTMLGLNRLIDIKNNMNNKRTFFDWAYLKT